MISNLICLTFWINHSNVTRLNIKTDGKFVGKRGRGQGKRGQERRKKEKGRDGGLSYLK